MTGPPSLKSEGERNVTGPPSFISEQDLDLLFEIQLLNSITIFWSFLFGKPTFLAFLRDKGLKILVLFAPWKENYDNDDDDKIR